MDMIREKGQYYAFTQTLNSNYRTYNLKRQLEFSLDALLKWLRPFTYDYELYVELHQDGNIHYHGILDIKDKIKYFKTLKSHVDQVGWITLKPIKDCAQWVEYCRKDMVYMKELFKMDLPIWKMGDMHKVPFIRFEPTLDSSDDDCECIQAVCQAK